MEGRPGGSGAAAAKREKVNVGLLEDRIRDTMRFHGLLDSTVSCPTSFFVLLDCQR
jgi:transcriptional adapter 3